MHAIEDITASLRTGAPVNPTDGPQLSTCWTCKSPDVPRMMEALGVDSFYNNKWGAMGAEIVNPIGCSDLPRPGNNESSYQPSGFELKLSNAKVKTSLCLLRKKCVHWSVRNVTLNISSKVMEIPDFPLG